MVGAPPLVGPARVKLDRAIERGTILEVERDALPPDRGGRVLRVPARRAAGGGGERPCARKRQGRGARRVANDVLELDTGVLLPMVEECILKVDLEASCITVAAGFAD